MKRSGSQPDRFARPVNTVESSDVEIPPVGLGGILQVPARAHSLVSFVHGSGSSRFSPRNRTVAKALNRNGIATLLFDLLKPEEESDRRNVFNVSLLADRVVETIHWLDRKDELAGLPFGLFGASTGAAAAIIAAAKCPDRVRAVVSRGGRPDLAGPALDIARAPTLLLVGGADVEVLELNRQALTRLQGPKALEVIAGASHLFPEPGALEAVVQYAAAWFLRYLSPSAADAS